MKELSYNQRDGLRRLAYICTAQAFADMLNPQNRGPTWSWELLPEYAYNRALEALWIGSFVRVGLRAAERPDVQEAVRKFVVLAANDLLVRRSGILSSLLAVPGV